jgi:hypothetical protein
MWDEAEVCGELDAIWDLSCNNNIFLGDLIGELIVRLQ